MSLVTIKGVRREIGARVILEDVEASVAAGERIGLVGPNGAGKTTLLRLIAGHDEPDAGSVNVSRGLRINLLTQESAQDPALLAASSLTDAVRGGAAEIVTLAEELRRMEIEGAAASAAYADARHRFDALDGYALEDRIAAALRGLGFPTARHSEPPQRLSGGEQTRVALARLVIADPDLLLLDEPTNHLDIDAMEWLEGALRARRGALLVSSHDRTFLDAVVDRIWEVRNHHVTRFRGGYSAYHLQREAAEGDAERDAERRTKEIAREKELIQTYRSHRKYAKMHEHERRLAAIEAPEAPKRRVNLALSTTGAGRAPAEAIRISEAVVGYREPTEKRIASVRSLVLGRGDRIGIVGPNGAGKSTLLKSVAGLLPPLDGEITLGQGAITGYLAQVRAAGLHGTTVLDALCAAVPIEPSAARAHLARFLFRGEDVGKEVRVLSGGERSRLELAILGLLPANILLLDEPTNHLDVDACESLERFLLDDERTLLLVSHDRRLLERVCTKLWVVGDGLAVPFDGGWKEWRRAISEGWTAQSADATVAARTGFTITSPALASTTGAGDAAGGKVKRSATKGGAAAVAGKSAAPERPVKLSKEQARRRRAAIEGDLERHGLRKSQLELELLDPRVASSYTDLARVSAELADVTAALSLAEEAWLELEGEAPK
ncbi:MAG: ABC transporter ATP-binding protein [Chloroflexi bacterium]|nr:MAG: ABC transporter ATP-binding protein [Chloroflexota bacterium]